MKLVKTILLITIFAILGIWFWLWIKGGDKVTPPFDYSNNQPCDQEALQSYFHAQDVLTSGNGTKSDSRGLNVGLTMEKICTAGP